MQTTDERCNELAKNALHQVRNIVRTRQDLERINPALAAGPLTGMVTVRLLADAIIAERTRELLVADAAQVGAK